MLTLWLNFYSWGCVGLDGGGGGGYFWFRWKGMGECGVVGRGKYEKRKQSGVDRSWMDWVEILDRDTFKLGLVGGVGFAIGFVRN